MKKSCVFYVVLLVIFGGSCCAADQFDSSSDPIYIDNSTLGLPADGGTQTSTTPQLGTTPSADQINVSSPVQENATATDQATTFPTDSTVQADTQGDAASLDTTLADSAGVEEQPVLEDTQSSATAIPTDSMQKQDPSVDRKKGKSGRSRGVSGSSSSSTTSSMDIDSSIGDSTKKDSHKRRGGRVPRMKGQLLANRDQLQKRTSKVKRLQQLSDQRLQNKLHERSINNRIASKMPDKKMQEQRPEDLRRGIKKKREAQGKGGPVRKRRIKRFDVPTDDKKRPRVATQN